MWGSLSVSLMVCKRVVVFSVSQDSCRPMFIRWTKTPIMYVLALCDKLGGVQRKVVNNILLQNINLDKACAQLLFYKHVGLSKNHRPVAKGSSCGLVVRSLYILMLLSSALPWQTGPWRGAIKQLRSSDEVLLYSDATHLGSTHVGKLVGGEGQSNHCGLVIQSL